MEFNREIKPNELKKLVTKFFEEVPQEKWNTARLNDYIGISKQRWQTYQKKDEYSEICKFAMQKIEMKYLDDLNKPACTGAIFALKNFAGYSDRQDVNATLEGGLKLEDMLKGKGVKA